ncbi:MAG TPA: hypothetical protein PKG96_08295 [Bacilli bacterium]|jgi:hypothetical protein|nr:hypothetical protein [Bacilli bacterium]
MNYNWKEILAHAERFHKAATYLNNQSDSDIQIVSWTNSAFAIELYYKALYFKIHNKKPNQTHKLGDIYSNFPINIKEEIKESYYAELRRRDSSALQKQIKDLRKVYPDFSEDFEWNLKEIEKAFLNFRYIYEKKKASLVFYPELRMSILYQFKNIKS